MAGPDFFTAMEVSASGMSAERTRMNVAASNLANAQTTQGPNGGPYQRRDVLLQSTTAPGTDGEFAQAVHGVEVKQITQDTSAPRLEYEAGITSMSTAVNMAERALGIGK